MTADISLSPPAGLTVRDVARRYRVGEDKVRAWIARGELVAVNTASALCGRPRWVILPDALAAFERRRAGGPPPKTARRRKRTCSVDYYPD
jgi:transposase